jgi:hypothetical protein
VVNKVLQKFYPRQFAHLKDISKESGPKGSGFGLPPEG